MDLLNKLRTLANDYYNNTHEEKYSIIIEMLSNDSCFFLLSSQTALAILNDLGFSDEESLRMYEKLINIESYQKTFKKVIVK